MLIQANLTLRDARGSLCGCVRCVLQWCVLCRNPGWRGERGMGNKAAEFTEGIRGAEINFEKNPSCHDNIMSFQMSLNWFCMGSLGWGGGDCGPRSPEGRIKIQNSDKNDNSNKDKTDSLALSSVLRTSSCISGPCPGSKRTADACFWGSPHGPRGRSAAVG